MRGGKGLDFQLAHSGLESFYSESVRSLFILAMREDTLRSIVRLPTSTTKPPTISGLTCRGKIMSESCYISSQYFFCSRRPKAHGERGWRCMTAHTVLVTLSFCP